MDTIKTNFKWNGELKKRTSTEFEIVHHAKSIECTVEDIHKWHLDRGWLGIGYNWFINKKGEEYEGRPEWASDADAQGYNKNSLSICLEGNFEVETLGEVQREALIKRMVKNRLKYPHIKSMRHKDVNKTKCPGEIGWIEILAEVENRIRDIKKQKESVDIVDKLEQKVKDLDSKVTRILRYLDSQGERIR